MWPWTIRSSWAKYVSILSESILSLYSSSEIAGALCQIPSKVRSGTKKSNETPPNTWRPLVIIIPLRLGLSDVNTEYIDQLKV